jgi:hypothetical protein
MKNIIAFFNTILILIELIILSTQAKEIIAPILIYSTIYFWTVYLVLTRLPVKLPDTPMWLWCGIVSLLLLLYFIYNN